MVKLLDVPIAYFLISMGISSIYGECFAWACPEPAPFDGLSFREAWTQLRGSRLSLVLLGFLVLISCGVLLLALSALANDCDRLAIDFRALSSTSIPWRCSTPARVWIPGCCFIPTTVASFTSSSGSVS